MPFDVYAIGPLSASVCTDLGIEEATRLLNEENPTGISSRWAWAEGETFADGTPNPNTCEENGNLKHYLFHCQPIGQIYV